MQIVVLAGWYPVKHNPYNGDFVQRHAQAISLVADITVIHVTRDKSVRKKNVVRLVTQGVNEIIFYLPERGHSLFHKAISFLEYYFLVSKELGEIKKHQKIDLLHLHIVNGNGILALIRKLLFQQRYIITEHSTSYVNGHWESLSFLKRQVLKWIFKNADSLHFVSKFLEQKMLDKFVYKKKTVVIPNVVNTNIFYPLQSNRSALKTFIHISNLTAQKNVKQILAAFGQIKRKGYQFLLKVVGPESNVVKGWIEKFDLGDNIEYLQEMPQSELNKEINLSDALILFSNYETFGCVVIESLSCGKSVIVSNIPVLKEFETEGSTGIIAINKNEDELAQCLMDFLNNKFHFEEKNIREFAVSRYSYSVVANQFLSWYKSLL